MNGRRILQRVYDAERQAVVARRNSGDISNEVMHRLERELDLEEAHLESRALSDGLRRAFCSLADAVAVIPMPLLSSLCRRQNASARHPL